MQKFSLLLVLLAFALPIGGCLQNDLRFHIRFQQAAGLAQGDRVLLAGKTIGEVERIQRVDDGSFWIAVRVESEFRPQVTDRARFWIQDDPRDPHRCVIWIEPGEGGQPIADGALVQGSDSLSLFAPLLKGLGQGLETFEQQLKGLTEELEKLPQSPEFQQLQRQLEELARQMKEAEDKMQKDVLPKLQEEMERLQREMEKARPKQPPQPPGRQRRDGLEI